VANSVLFVVAYMYFRRKGYLFGVIKKKYLKSELQYAVPIIVMQCSIFSLASSDKFFLSYFSTNNVVGIYSYACVFAAVVTIACSSLMGYIMPRIYSCLAAPVIDYPQIRKYFFFYVGGCFTVLVAIIAFTPFMYKLFINDSYHSGLQYMYLIAIGYFIWSVINFFYSFLLYNKQKKRILVLSLISIAINLTSNYFLIKKWGAGGAALSVCLSYFLVLVTTLIMSYKNVRLLFATK
jgi:O-antigen/teichoic acid export membrane protein